jgi:hypothetical protein
MGPKTGKPDNFRKTAALLRTDGSLGDCGPFNTIAATRRPRRRAASTVSKL